jgi:hypothetical protein
MHNRGPAVPGTLDTTRMLTWADTGGWEATTKRKADRD